MIERLKQAFILQDQELGASQQGPPMIPSDTYNDSTKADHRVPEAITPSGRQVKSPVRFLDTVIGWEGGDVA